MTQEELISALIDALKRDVLANCASIRADASPITAVYLLTSGTGEDGDEWHVESIHSSREKAEAAKANHPWANDVEIEEWEVS